MQLTMEPLDEMLAKRPVGIIFSGGPASVHVPDAPLIDPAVYGGHREIDLAMLALFGTALVAILSLGLLPGTASAQRAQSRPSCRALWIISPMSWRWKASAVTPAESSRVSVSSRVRGSKGGGFLMGTMS